VSLRLVHNVDDPRVDAAPLREPAEAEQGRAPYIPPEWMLREGRAAMRRRRKARRARRALAMAGLALLAAIGWLALRA
jgi:hypothetical protein